MGKPHQHEWGLSLGGFGPEAIQDTSAHTGNYYAIQAGANGCTIDSVTGLTGTWSSFPLAGGQTVLFGSDTATSITLSEGEALLYRRDTAINY